MPKSEKFFEMLRFLKEYPGLKAADLSKLCNVSERGIYRYIKTIDIVYIQSMSQFVNWNLLPWRYSKAGYG